MMMRWIDLLLFPIGHPQGGVEITVALLVRVILIVAYGWFVVAGFKTDWRWGIGNLLFPPAALAYFYLYPERGRWPGILFLIGMLVFMLTMVVFKQRMPAQPQEPYSESTARSPHP